MIAVPLETSTILEVGTPRMLFEGQYLAGTGPGNGTQFYDVSSDCQRFVMIQAEQVPTQIHVVLNWYEELKRLAPRED
jgi:hypothetical protein